MFNYFDISQFFNYYHNFVYRVYYSPITTTFHFVILLSISFYYYKKHLNKNSLRSFFFPALLLRIFFMILAFLLCEFPFNIGGDAMSFFTDSRCYTILIYQNPFDYFKQLWELFPTHPFLLLTLKNLDYPRNLFVIKLLSILNLITFSDYFANSFYIILFVFLGTWKLSNLFAPPSPPPNLAEGRRGVNNILQRWAPLLFLFLPSVCYFSSSTSKDSVSTGALFFIIYYVLKILFFSYKLKWFEYLWIFGLSYLLYKTKFYMLEAIIPPALALVASNYIFNKNKFFGNTGLNWSDRIKITIVFFLIYGMSLLIPVMIIHYNSYSIDKILLGIFNEYDTSILFFNKSLHIQLDPLEPTLWSYLKYFPKTVFSTLYRPFIWEIQSLFMMVPALENLTILVLTLVSVFIVIKSGTYQNVLNNRAVFLLFLFLISYVLFTAGMLGITSPVFGTLLRYRVMIFPFFWVLVLMGFKFR